MSDITITQQQAFDLRRIVDALDKGNAQQPNSPNHECLRGIVASFPKPRIVVRPGMVLQRNSDGVRGLVRETFSSGWWVSMASGDKFSIRAAGDQGFDPAEWTVLLEAEA